MKKVLFLLKSYLANSETFTYNLLNNFSNVKPVLHVEKLINLDRFSLKWDCERYVNSDKSFHLFKRATEIKNISNHIYECCKKNKPDIIHANALNRAIYAVQTSKKLNIPLVTQCRGSDVYVRYNNPTSRREILKAIPHIAKFITVSYALKVFLINKFGVDAEKIDVHYGGINLDLFSFREKIDTNNPSVLIVSRFSETKGVDVGIKAFAEAQKTNNKLKLKIIGDGPKKDSYIELAETLGITNKVEFLGTMDSKQIAEQMNQSDIFLAPHVIAKNGAQEGIPNTIKEAMAVGLPVVATDVGGIKEIVQDKYTGVLCGANDIDLLAENIADLSVNPVQGLIYARNARNNIEMNFDSKKQVLKLEGLYEGI